METPYLCAAQRFSLLGSTGSIGTQTLDIVREQPDRFEIVALAAGGNLDLLADQARQNSPTELLSPDDSFGDLSGGRNCMPVSI